MLAGKLRKGAGARRARVVNSNILHRIHLKFYPPTKPSKLTLVRRGNVVSAQLRGIALY